MMTMRILWFIHKVNTFCAERTFTYISDMVSNISEEKLFVGTNILLFIVPERKQKWKCVTMGH